MRQIEGENTPRKMLCFFTMHLSCGALMFCCFCMFVPPGEEAKTRQFATLSCRPALYGARRKHNMAQIFQIYLAYLYRAEFSGGQFWDFTHNLSDQVDCK